MKRNQLQAPRCRKCPEETVLHGERRVDAYAWLRDAEDPTVLAHIEAENAYTDGSLAHTKPLQNILYQEMLGRIQENDDSVPAPHGPYRYFERTHAGKAYGQYLRQKRDDATQEEVLLDVDALAEGHTYTDVSSVVLSPNHRFLAYGIDYEGSERFDIRFRDLDRQEDLLDVLSETSGSGVWAADNQSFFYVVLDERQRPYRLFCHRLSGPTQADVLIYEETDARFALGVSRTTSEAYILLSIDSAVTSEVRWIPTSAPDQAPTVVWPRRHGVEYEVDHRDDSFLLLTNDSAKNFRVLEWQFEDGRIEEIVSHRTDVVLEGLTAFESFLVIEERERGLPHLRILDLDTKTDYRIPFDEAAYDLWVDTNLEFDTRTLRFGYTSMATPASIYEWSLDASSRTLLKVTPVLGYDSRHYATERIEATSLDGTRVPISLVYRREHAARGPMPLLLQGYGSYGLSYDPAFSSSAVSLLDRGIAIGIAHVRGGGDLGRHWKEEGKLAKKENTFRDFVACMSHLIEEGYTRPELLLIGGRSAGGLLVAAVSNLRPDLFVAAIAGVPFVDVINTLLDPSLPLTVVEWEEWGNPAEMEAYRILKRYDPYQNVQAQAYPSILATAGLHDPRVGYWEPAKWIARLREHNTGNQPLFLRVQIGAGHFGESGRYGYLRQQAFEYAFLLDRLGLASAGNMD
jgi:oligopeptidase B